MKGPHFGPSCFGLPTSHDPGVLIPILSAHIVYMYFEPEQCKFVHAMFRADRFAYLDKKTNAMKETFDLSTSHITLLL